MADAGFPGHAHDAFDRIEEQFNTALDDSLNPAGPDVLYDCVAQMKLPAGAVAIDVGSGQGRQAVELSRRFGLLVTGIDPFPQRAEAIGEHARPGDAVSFLAGTAEDLPVPSGSADLVWCRDVLSLVEDLGRVYREFRRVLKPGGRAVIYQTFATSRLEPGEAAFLLPVMGCSAACASTAA